MRLAFRLVLLLVFLVIIVVIGRGLSFTEFTQWFLITAAIWVAFWAQVTAKVTGWVANKLFNTNVDWQWQPNGKYAYSRGFVHLVKDGVNLGRDSCLVTIFLWALNTLFFVLGFQVVIPSLANWLSANF